MMPEWGLVAHLQAYGDGAVDGSSRVDELVELGLIVSV